MGNAVPVSKKAFDKIQWNHFLYIQVIYIEKRTRTKGSWGEIIKEIFSESFDFVYCVWDCGRESVAAGTGENAEVSDSLGERREK